MKNLMEQETRSGDATMIDVETLLEGFLNLSPKDLPHLFKYQGFQILSF